MAIDPKRVKEIFLEAAELEDEADRTAYLDRACGNDAGLRARVEALLLNHDPERSFLGTPAAVVSEPDRAIPPAFAANANPSVASGADLAATESLSRARDAVPDGQGSTATASDEEPLTFLLPPQRPDSLGRIGHYEVLQILGRGGFGIVFRAFDEMLQRVVALKVMAPQLAATSPARKRFLREARSSAQVRHENVVQVYEVAEQPLPYLAMEFIPGETLQQRLDRVGPLDVPEVLRIGRQIAEGLAAAHATDLIHRDIKPGNVLLEGGQHKVKITDFGLARAADDASISQSGIIAGTPMYMAPEQAQGQTLDQRADLFSLGSVLYQMVAGRPPFRANSTLAVLKRVAEDTPRDIREIIPETPQWLCDIIAKLHAKDPDDRYQSAREVADVLADSETQPKANAKLKDYSRIPRTKPQPSGRRKWVAVALAALLLAFAGLWFGRAAMLYFSDRGELELLPETGLVSVIVLQNNEGVLDGDKLHAPVTDWLDMKKSHTLNLPSGRYQLNVGTWPASTRAGQWEVTTSGPLGSNVVTVPVINSSAIVTVERGRRVTLRAKLLTVLPRSAAFAADRGAAEYVLSIGGTVRVDDNDGDIKAPQGELPTGAFRLTYVDLHNNNLVSDFGLAVFKDCKNLKYIDLRFTQVGDDGLVYFKDSKNLTHLDLNSTKVTDVGLMHLKDFTALKNLSLPHTTVTDSGLAPFKVCKNLVYLDLNGCTKVTDAGLLAFKECKSIVFVLLERTGVTDAGLANLKDCKNLIVLSLVETKVTDAGLAHWKDCKALTALFLSGTKVSDTGLANFKGMPLTVLWIYNTGITDLTPLRGMQLEEIRLTPKNITKGLDILRDMKSLKTIGIEWGQAWPAAEFWQRYDEGEFK